jgi:hypothetical protein
MAIHEAQKIDLLGVDKASGVVRLTISDHLDWSDELDHLSTLQAKINSYLLFLESGEIYEKYPKAIGRSIDIAVVMKYAPSDPGHRFLEQARKVVNDAGFGFTYTVL